MIKTTHETIVKTLGFMVFAFVLSFLFCGCSFLNKQNQTASVVFSLNQEICEQILHSEANLNADSLFLDVELKGDYSASKTLPLDKSVEVKFDSIQSGTELFVEASAYRLEYDKKLILYSGKSEPVKIEAGENKITLVLTKTGASEPFIPDPPPEEDIMINLYVSGTGDDVSGDGTETNPFETVDKACESIIAQGTKNTVWTIYIMGDVTGPHEGSNKAGARGYTKDF